MTYQPRDPFLPTSEIPPPRPKSTKPVWIVLGVVAVICLVFCGVGAIALSGEPGVKTAVAEDPPPLVGVPDPGVRPSVTPSEPKPSPKTAAAPPEQIGDGTYLVGEDIPAGTYRSPGAEESAFQLCAWSVRKGESTDADYLDGGSANKTKAPQRVQLKKGHVFQTTGCQDWVKK